uniref:Complex I assembly factor TIMMDC1, mitochondrial n=1 Tax=Timema genevievae TaxID=629358 RepID=A0A7R9JNL7_TIMGE|nr:unnamed protein product [Timema genevievae]
MVDLTSFECVGVGCEGTVEMMEVWAGMALHQSWGKILVASDPQPFHLLASFFLLQPVAYVHSPMIVCCLLRQYMVLWTTPECVEVTPDKFCLWLVSFHSRHYNICYQSENGLYKMAQGIDEIVSKEIIKNNDIIEFGVSSPELHSVFQSGFLGTTLGVLMGGFYRTKNTYLNFIERNQATVFRDHLEAKKKLQDQVTINFAKGAFYWGWRIGLFTSTYVLITTSISVYRGKSSILEYLAAGCITGSCFKMNMGVKGMVVGGLLGSALGGLAGGFSLAIFKITGTSMEDVRYWQYRWKQERVKQEQKVFKTYEEKEDFPLLKHHNQKIGPAGETLTALDSEPAANASE